MDLETVFSLCSLAVMPAWVLLILAPRWRFTARVAHSVPIFVLLCVVYQALRVVGPELPAGAGLTSLEAFMIAVSSPWAALVTWIHILVVDLFVGAWMLRDAQRLGIAHGWIAPCLIVTFVAAPLGLLAYVGVRAVLARKWSVEEAVT